MTCLRSTAGIWSLDSRLLVLNNTGYNGKLGTDEQGPGRTGPVAYTSLKGEMSVLGCLGGSVDGHLPLVLVVVLGSWDRTLSRAPCSALWGAWEDAASS